jgi:hypothetical protein
LLTRGDHVAVLEWYRDAIDQGVVGSLVPQLEEIEVDAMDADYEDEEAERHDILAALPHDLELHQKEGTSLYPERNSQAAKTAPGKDKSPQATRFKVEQEAQVDGIDQGAEAGMLCVFRAYARARSR